jgi:hypothetical protein
LLLPFFFLYFSVKIVQPPPFFKTNNPHLTFISAIFYCISFVGCLQHMYSELGVDLHERSYGGNCALILPNGGGINWPVIKATVFDEFVVAHTLGWWGKALIIRDNVMLWIIR